MSPLLLQLGVLQRYPIGVLQTHFVGSQLVPPTASLSLPARLYPLLLYWRHFRLLLRYWTPIPHRLASLAQAGRT